MHIQIEFWKRKSHPEKREKNKKQKNKDKLVCGILLERWNHLCSCQYQDAFIIIYWIVFFFCVSFLFCVPREYIWQNGFYMISCKACLYFKRIMGWNWTSIIVGKVWIVKNWKEKTLFFFCFSSFTISIYGRTKYKKNISPKKKKKK